jgi:hypothetical protein
MDDKIREYIDRIKPNWRPFLERLADTVHAHNPERQGWGPEDESWIKLVNHLDGVATAYVAWQGLGISENGYGPIDDARVLELIQPCGLSQIDQQVFLTSCRQFLKDLLKIKARISGEEENETDAPN